MSRAAAWAALGFIVGTIAGFIYGGRVKDAAPSAVNTDYKDGKITVVVDAAQALKNGLPNWIK